MTQQKTQAQCKLIGNAIPKVGLMAERNAAICEAWLAGVSAPSIGRRHGISGSAVWSITQIAGAIRPAKPPKTIRMSRLELNSYRHACIRLSHRCGMTPAEIADTFGVGAEAVRHIIRVGKANPFGIEAQDKAAFAMRKAFGGVSILKKAKNYTAMDSEKYGAICNAYLNGLETRELADKFNLSRPGIYRILQKNQIQLRPMSAKLSRSNQTRQVLH